MGHVMSIPRADDALGSLTVALPQGWSSFTDSIPDETHRRVTGIHDLLTSIVGKGGHACAFSLRFETRREPILIQPLPFVPRTHLLP